MRYDNNKKKWVWDTNSFGYIYEWIMRDRGLKNLSEDEMLKNKFLDDINISIELFYRVANKEEIDKIEALIKSY
jgi:hypothetical protein